MIKNLKTEPRVFKWLLTPLIVLMFACFTHAQTSALQLEMPHQTVASGDTVHVNIEANNFVDMVSIQFSINFDPNVIQFESSSLMDLDYVAVGSTDAVNGNLRVSWFDIQGTGENMIDGKHIIKLVFLTVGEVGDYSDVEISGSPLEIQTFRGNSDIFFPIDLDIGNGSVTIIDGDALNFSASVNEIACNGSDNGSIEISLNDSENYTYTWTGPEGFISSEANINELTGGDYQLTILDANGEVVLDTIFTITQPLGALIIDEISTVDVDCGGEAGLASIYPTGGTPPYMYDIGNGVTSQNNLSDLDAGTYNITVTDANDCEVISTFSILATGGPDIDLGEDMNVCQGEEVFLEVGTFETYAWSTGATSSSLSVSESGTYIVTVTDNNCVSVDTIEVLFDADVELTVAGDFLSLCPGDSIQLLLLGADEYQWLDDTGTLDNLNATNPTARPEVSTEYAVIASNECGVDTSTIEVNVYEVTATAGPNVCVSPGETVQLNASGGVHYYWIGGDYPLSDYNIANPTVVPEDSSTYEIMIVDENNCTTFDEVTVLVASNPLSFIKYINIITPNGDGDNDVLDFGDIGKYGTNTLKVFNRWGSLVYEKLDYQKGDERFDGNFKGEPLPAGTYYYVLSFRDETLKQTLTIIRDQN